MVLRTGSVPFRHVRILCVVCLRVMVDIGSDRSCSTYRVPKVSFKPLGCYVRGQSMYLAFYNPIVSQLQQDLPLPPVHVCERPRAPSQRRSPTIFPLAIGQPLRCLKRQSPYRALVRRVRTSVCVGALMYLRGHLIVRM